MLASLPVVQDPWFHAVAVLAVLVTGLSMRGFASGFGALATPTLRVNVALFHRLAFAGMFLTRVKLLWDGVL